MLRFSRQFYYTPPLPSSFLKTHRLCQATQCMVTVGMTTDCLDHILTYQTTVSLLPPWDNSWAWFMVVEKIGWELMVVELLQKINVLAFPTRTSALPCSQLCGVALIEEEEGHVAPSSLIGLCFLTFVDFTPQLGLLILNKRKIFKMGRCRFTEHPTHVSLFYCWACFESFIYLCWPIVGWPENAWAPWIYWTGLCHDGLWARIQLGTHPLVFHESS